MEQSIDEPETASSSGAPVGKNTQPTLEPLEPSGRSEIREIATTLLHNVARTVRRADDETKTAITVVLMTVIKLMDASEDGDWDFLKFQLERIARTISETEL